MSLQPLPLPGAELALDPAWLAPAQADALWQALSAAILWEVHRLRLFGRELAAPRLSCWIGDPDAVYTYSGARFQPRPWPPALQPLRARLQAELGVAFNSVLANLYRDGRDSMGWHSDDEPALGPQPVIASLSLGATRRFVLKQRRDPACRLALDLPHGSLLLMAGDTQRHYRHALPRTARPLGPRLNLTFRRILDP
ncbi:alpha-ketoglutarate-dependent dioxygenase AlkB family protein [Cognatiluteimonas weifangensis]|uniref:Alpha-ketoglutarate-dependent dioxygenase AlkB n=1 Tax=Cognatiluteimonas weifangensis TaxID=2303539 RepID=A0A372DM40_9GAMM|nr:alpha-ketoglutarate-dependent dioxygenase AlkB [Luteimonas weifangensis]RFP60544.1 alpha-ketoglutarate-dependent dioxygenase AlkB [Luteimonas weifangensis]